jgi:hypothetical protein
MDHPRSGRPPSSSRPARRSLVDFALPPSRASVEMASTVQTLPTVSPALDYANGKADSREDTLQGAEKITSSVGKTTDEHYAKAFEVMTASINSTLEYARRLVDVKRPSEFIELSASHARKQCDSIIKQASELRLAAADFVKALGAREE